MSEDCSKEASQEEDSILQLKSEGNAAFASSAFEKAKDRFSAAIDLIRARIISLKENKAVTNAPLTEKEEGLAEDEAIDEGDDKALEEAQHLAAVLFCNRSMSWSALGDWKSSMEDARVAIELNAKYEKAYFRLVKAHLELNNYKEARLYLTIGLGKCPDSKFLKALDSELFSLTGIPSRPKPTDFDIIDELGEGNFSKIFKAKYKPTGKVFAIKTIEKQTVERMKRRHKNIHNEILMEKRILNKFCHPNIVHLYATFQDFGTLYYQMEFMGGGEVWTMIQDDVGGSYEKVNRGSASSVGCYFSLARFYISECLNAVEYMHRNGIVHRDLKPENMMITASGHLKLVDFGTCKDLKQTNLNGQEFVGTAEYMAPEVVNSENSGPAADLWSLGIILYHMYTGHAPFRAPSPYLSFLRTKRAFLRLYSDLPHAAEVNEVVYALLEKDPSNRLTNASSLSYDPMNADEFSYDKLRKCLLFQMADELNAKEKFVKVGESLEVSCSAVRVPTLREMSVRAVANASIMVAERIAMNGGLKNLPNWIQNFKLTVSNGMDASDRASVMLYLSNKNELHSASVYRLFYTSIIDSRSCRTDLVQREYYGFSRATQGQWSRGFSAVHFVNPMFGQDSLAAGAEVTCDKEHARLRTAISAINKMRPKFVVVCGNFTAVANDASQMQDSKAHASLTSDFRRCMARISETIPVLYVPGVNDVGTHPTPESLAKYNENYGADFYGFWFGGVRVLVINSTLLINPESAPSQASFQHTWLIEELEQCKLCAMQVVVFSYHSFLPKDAIDGEDEDALHTVRGMPRAVREYWLPRFRNFKVKFIFSANSNTASETRSFSRDALPRKKKARTGRVEELSPEDDDQSNKANLLGGEEEEERRARRRERDDGRRGSELKPSEILAQAGLSSSDSSSSDSESDQEDREGRCEQDGQYEKDSPFSPDLKCTGPVAVSTPAMGGAPASCSSPESGVLRQIDFVNEESAEQRLHTLEDLPTKLPDLA